MSFTILFTGIPAAGKTTLARHSFDWLISHGINAQLLDSDFIPLPFARAFSSDAQGREARLRSMGYAAWLLNEKGIACIMAATAPRQALRQELRLQFKRLLIVHVACAVETAQRRDPKGLYALARAQLITDFTAVQSPYEPPSDPDFAIDTASESAGSCCEKTVAWLQRKIAELVHPAEILPPPIDARLPGIVKTGPADTPKEIKT